ncbi:hypothetical protein G7B40_019435 [Aetokthonos hydrillicola Thurmond2011]|jgi:hypothetical protein|uniref:Uncharacterized protein n=1 Tax=Aetokthonos hydrillicola Thurmond2011 TaxID=2712845 RepID=A0AAP5MBD5_9CYAN|nr:hypothetical protein [Aetokthonos hydrillicola]MBO3458893.1 hypothetical protein [Aetokthonos hydrillicola CCALA 1050]MBW4587258.1 hypothetical protein [Aetokthonos hydrillicola CCALA 1050]MDR9896719.1 hypothetical protein [Aetokthonos hydrillicola Thurmond2011]
MNKPNLEAMTQQELQKYILEHRDDEDAVHEAVLRIQQHGRTVTSDEFIEIVKQRATNPPQPQ